MNRFLIPTQFAVPTPLVARHVQVAVTVRALALLMILEDGQSVVYRQRVLDPVPVACLAVTRTLIAPQEHTVVEAVLMMRATVGAALQAV